MAVQETKQNVRWCSSLEETLELTRNDPLREPEALYWSTAIAFRLSGDRKDLNEGWNRLLDKFPQSEWAKRAGYIRQQ